MILSMTRAKEVTGDQNRTLGQDKYLRLHIYSDITAANADIGTAEARLIYLASTQTVWYGRPGAWVEIVSTESQTEQPAYDDPGDLPVAAEVALGNVISADRNTGEIVVTTSSPLITIGSTLVITGSLAVNGAFLDGSYPITGVNGTTLTIAPNSFPAPTAPITSYGSAVASIAAPVDGKLAVVNDFPSVWIYKAATNTWVRANDADTRLVFVDGSRSFTAFPSVTGTSYPTLPRNLITLDYALRVSQGVIRNGLSIVSVVPGASTSIVTFSTAADPLWAGYRLLPSQGNANDKYWNIINVAGNTVEVTGVMFATGAVGTAEIKDIEGETNATEAFVLEKVGNIEGISRKLSCGGTSRPTTTIGLTGLLNVSSMTANLIPYADFTGDIEEFTIAPLVNYQLTANTYYYVTVIYNAGNPVYEVITDNTIINHANRIAVCNVMWENYGGINEGHIFCVGAYGLGLTNKVSHRLIHTERFGYQDGLMLGESGTRNITCTSGTIWYDGEEIGLGSVNTGTTHYHLYYHSAPNTWTAVLRNSYSNTEYDDNTGGLKSTQNNHYVVNWVYRGVTNGDIYVLLGSMDYKLIEAQHAQPPASLPPVVSKQAILVGRIIVLQGAATATEIGSAFGTTFTSSGVIAHNDTSGLNTGDYIHLTAAQNTAVLGSKTANTVYASPDGSAGVGGFRSLVVGDLPVTTSIGTPGVDTLVPTEKAVRDLENAAGAITKEPTGFADESAVSITGNADRTITLTQSGGVVYYYQNQKYTQNSPYTSPAHGTDTNTIYYLTFGTGGTFTWKTTPFDFRVEGQVSIAEYINGAWRYLREVHGLMPWEAHLEAHDRLGTYLKSGGLLTTATYAVTPASPTDADNTPGIDVATIKDEDCNTSIAAWTQGTYTQLWLNAGIATYSDVATLPFRMGTTYPLINGVETSTGKFFNVYAIFVPMALGTDSQKYRVLWFQPQIEYSTLGLATAESFYALSLGNIGNVFAEYAPYIQITYGTNASWSGATGRCRIESVKYLQGTRTSGGGTGASATSPGGTNGQVQYNNNGSFGGIPEGTAGQVLTSGGPGVAPSFTTISSGGSGGGGWGKSSILTLSSPQTTNLSNGNRIAFDTIYGDHSLSSNRVLVKGGSRVCLKASLGVQAASASCGAGVQWYNYTSGVFIGKASILRPQTFSGDNYPNQQEAVAVLDVASDTEFELRFIDAVNITSININYTWATVESTLPQSNNTASDTYTASDATTITTSTSQSICDLTCGNVASGLYTVDGRWWQSNNAAGRVVLRASSNGGTNWTDLDTLGTHYDTQSDRAIKGTYKHNQQLGSLIFRLFFNTEGNSITFGSNSDNSFGRKLTAVGPINSPSFGGGWGKSGMLGLSTDQATGLTVNSPVLFDTATGDFTVSNGSVVIKGGSKAELMASMTARSAAADTPRFQWYDVTNSQWVGSIAEILPSTFTNNNASSPVCFAIVNPASDTTYQLRIKFAASLNLIYSGFTMAKISATYQADQWGKGIIIPTDYDAMIMSEPTLTKYWPMNEPSGTTVTDVVTNTTTNIGASITLGGSPLKLFDGKPLASFAAQSGGINLGAFDGAQSTSYTLEFWFSMETLGSVGNGFETVLGWQQNYCIGFLPSVYSAAYDLLILNSGPVAAKTKIGFSILRHIVLTFDGVNTNFYIDGTLVGSNAGKVNGSGNLIFGGSAYNYYGVAINGGKFARYSSALSADSINYHYVVGTQKIPSGTSQNQLQKYVGTPGFSGGGWGKSGLLSNSGNQTTGLSIGSPVVFDTVTGDFPLSNNRVTIKGGSKCKLSATLEIVASSGNAGIIAQWYNVTTNSAVGVGLNTNSYTWSVDGSHYSNTAIAVENPASDTQYELRITAISSVTSIKARATIESTVPTGGAWASSSQLILGSPQTTNLALNDPIKFTSIVGDHSLSNYGITIKGGTVAILRGNASGGTAGASSYGTLQWYNVTNSNWEGNVTEFLPLNLSGNSVPGGGAVARVSPSTDCVYQLRIQYLTGAGAITAIQNAAATVESTLPQPVAGGGWQRSGLLKLSADQTSNLTVNSPVLFDTSEGDFSVSGGSIVVKGGTKAELFFATHISVSGYVEFQWYNVTTSTWIGCVAQVHSMSSSAGTGGTGYALAYVSPASDTTYQVRIKTISGSSFVYIYANYTTAKISATALSGGAWAKSSLLRLTTQYSTAGYLVVNQPIRFDSVDGDHQLSNFQVTVKGGSTALLRGQVRYLASSSVGGSQFCWWNVETSSWVGEGGIGQPVTISSATNDYGVSVARVSPSTDTRYELRIFFLSQAISTIYNAWATVESTDPMWPSAGGWAKSSLLYKSSDQSGLTVGSRYLFDVVEGDHTIATTGKVTIKGGSVAQLSASLRAGFTASTANALVRWVNSSTGVSIGVGASLISISHTAAQSAQNVAVARVSPSVDTEYELRVITATETFTVFSGATDATGTSWVKVESTDPNPPKGGNWALASHLTLSADQSTNLTAGSPIRFDGISGDHTLSNYRVKIKGGQKAELRSSLFALFTGSTGYVDLVWYNYTNSLEVGTVGEIVSTSDTGHHAGAGEAYALVTPLVDTEYELRVRAVTALSKIYGGVYSYASVHSTLPNASVTSQVIKKDTVASNTTAWTVTLPVACKNLRVRLILLNPTGTINSVTLGVNGTSSGHMQQAYSSDGTTIGANEAVAPTLSSVPANSYVDYTQEYSIIPGVETTVKVQAGVKNGATNLATSTMIQRISQSADISTLTFTGDQTNGIGAGSYIIVERVDADLSQDLGWQDYTPTCYIDLTSATTVPNITPSVRYRIQGKTLFMQGTLNFTGAPTGATDLAISLPTGVTIPSWSVSQKLVFVGNASFANNSTLYYNGRVRLPLSTDNLGRIAFRPQTTISLTGPTTTTSPFTWANGHQLEFDFFTEIQ